jgi:hypothetical protein
MIYTHKMTLLGTHSIIYIANDIIRDLFCDLHTQKYDIIKDSFCDLHIKNDIIRDPFWCKSQKGSLIISFCV